MPASLHLPGPAIGEDIPGFGGSPVEGKLPYEEQFISYGTVPGANVREVAVTPAGSAHSIAPGGNLDLDLTTLTALNGTALSGLVGRCVYLAILPLTGLDIQTATGAANPLSVPLGDLHGPTELIRVRNNGALTAFTGPLFDATHKVVRFTSTSGATFRLIAGVL